MTDALATAPGVREQVSTRIMFFIAGFGMAAWAPLIPFAKARTGVDAGELGLLLLCLGLGSIATMPAAGALAARFGCRRVFTGATLALCLALLVLASASRIPLLAAGMLLFGASIGAIDVTANIQAIIVERASGRVMMSGFHGLLSLGGMAGAAGLTVLLGLGTTPLVATLGVVGGILAALLAGGPAMLPYGGQSDGPMFALTPGNIADITAAYPLVATLPPRGCLIGDAGYDATELRQELAFRGTASVIPTIATRKHKWSFDRQTYKERNLVERMFNGLKDFRRIATRYDRLARNFASAIALAAVVLCWTD